MNIIKFLFTIWAIFNLTEVTAREANDIFTLDGKINGNTREYLYITYTNKNDQQIIDSCIIEKGSFLFTGLIDDATLCSIYQKESVYSNKKLSLISFYLDPKALKIWIDNSGFRIEGSNTQDQNTILTNLKRPIYNSLDSIVKELDVINSLLKENSKSMDLINNKLSLQAKRLRFKEQEKIIDYNFFSTNPKSYLNPQILSYYFGAKKLSLDSTTIMFKQFDLKVQNSKKGKILMREIQGRKNSATGQLAPLFSKTDINGKVVDLSSFRARNYVLLDFWASWCIPCRKFTPTMKSYYQKYKSKGLEILSISWDSDDKAWKDAVNDDGMYLWKNVLANMYLPNDNSMRDKYSIPSIPLLILIDKNGVIVGRYMAPQEDGGQKELEVELDKILNN